ncbi:hypothetical protein [Actinocorallia longicatena]|uniref:Uncharacterized protein n=1 Tax=Actinocorallia longicatena TaxID=111803 RepID=A0ABP6Q461_9ACTN
MQSRADERERIAASLLALPQRPGYPLLKGAAPRGETADRAAAFDTLVTELWRLFDGYGRALDDGLDSVDLVDEQARPTLLGPPVTRLSLAEAVRRMTVLYDRATALLAAAHRDWERCVARVDRAESAHLLALRQEIDDPAIAPLAERLEIVRAEIRADPLTVPGGLGTLLAELEALAARLAEAAAARAGHHARIEDLRRALARLVDLAAHLAEVRTAADAKIARPPATTVPDHAALAALIGALPPLGARARWSELATALAEAETRLGEALATAHEDRELLQGLLDRRAELRGRFDAYSAKARRLGLLEKPEVTGHRETARALLWTSPCDLRQATVALAAFSKALSPEAAP